MHFETRHRKFRLNFVNHFFWIGLIHFEVDLTLFEGLNKVFDTRALILEGFVRIDIDLRHTCYGGTVRHS